MLRHLGFLWQYINPVNWWYWDWQPDMAQLCDNCHVKPRYPGHNYCGRTCAGEAMKRAGRGGGPRGGGPSFGGRGRGGPVGTGDPSLFAPETSPYAKYTATAGAGGHGHPYGRRPQREYSSQSQSASYQQSYQPSSTPGGYPDEEENTLMPSSPTGATQPYGSMQSADLCEVCHRRPKFREVDRYTNETKIHQYCGRTCAGQARGGSANRGGRGAARGAGSAPAPPPKPSNSSPGDYGSGPSRGYTRSSVKRCKLASCGKPCTGDYCTPEHARFHSYTQKPPKQPSQIPGTSSTAPDPDTTVLSLTDATSLAKVRDLFVNSWQSSSPADVPQVAAVLSVKLAEKYEKRFTTAMTQGVGTRTTFTTFFGGQCVCNLAAPVSQIPQPCYMTTCVICSVLRSSFDGVGFGDTWLKGPHGEGVYTSSTPRMAHRFTVGQANIPFRPMIVCDVIVVEDPTAQGNVIFDSNGQVVCKKKDNILPKFVVIYQPPPEIEIINRGMTGQLALPPPTAPQTGPEADYPPETPDEFDSGGYPVSDDEFAGLPEHPGGTLPPAYQDLNPSNVPDVNIPTIGHDPRPYHVGASHQDKSDSMSID